MTDQDVSPKKLFTRFKLLACLVLASLATACSALKLGYNNAPELGFWWLNNYISLNDEQSLQVRQDLAKLHPWHRSSELPKIADLLARMQQDAAKDVSPEQMCRVFADVRARLQAATDRAEPAAVALAMSLTSDQLADLDAKLKKSNTDWQKDWLLGTPEQRQTKRLAAAVDRAEQVYQTVTEAQRSLMKTHISSSSFDAQLSYNERLRRQQDMLQTLAAMGAGKQTKLSFVQAQALLKAYSERSLNSPNLQYRLYIGKATQTSCNNFAQLHNATTPEQRANAMAKLAGYARDARDLVALR